MATYYLERNDELAVAEETAYGTYASAPVGGDFFKHTSSSVSIVPNLEEGYRDRDRDSGQASVIDMFTGREKATIGVECDLIPSGNSGTPTAPDAHALLKAVFGAGATRTAHTATGAGSTGTTLELDTGGGAASGIAVGDLIAVDVSSGLGLEVRRVMGVSTDTVTIDRAFGANPAAGRGVYVGTTYTLSEASLVSLVFWLFNGANKYKVPGVVLNDFELACNFADGVPMLRAKFNGEGQPEVTHTETRPTPTTAGQPATPAIGKIFFGTTKVPIINASVAVKNGVELRNNESDQLKPTAAKRTGNNARYAVEQSIECYFTSDTKQYFDGSKARSALSTIVQLGQTVGKIVAWEAPNWRPRGERTSQDGEIGLKLSGRCLGVNGDDEVRLAII